MGGLSRKTYQMKQLREKAPTSSITLDAGNLLFKGQRVQHSQEALTAVGLMDIYRLMGYDAVAVGPVDLAAGIGLLKSGLEQGFPWLSANITDESNRPIFPATMVLNRGELRIGVVAVSGTPIPAPQGIKFADWRTILPLHLKTLTGQCELLIVLSSLKASENKELLRLFPQIPILITANEQQDSITPRITGETLVTQTSAQGKHLGVLKVNWLPGHGWGKDYGEEQMLLGEQLNILNRRMLRIKRDSVKLGTSPDQALGQLEQEKDRVIEKMRQTKKELQNPGVNNSTASNYDGSFIPLTANLPQDHDVSEAIDALKENIIAELDKSVTKSTSSDAASKVYPGIVGSSRCAECHQRQTEFWQSIGHSQAYATLQGQNQHFNLDCLPCHVTHTTGIPATGTPPLPQETMLSLPEDLRAVGCEMCHGPGESHVKSPEKSIPKNTVDQQTCTTCHTTDHDADFVYQHKISAINCPAD